MIVVLARHIGKCASFCARHIGKCATFCVDSCGFSFWFRLDAISWYDNSLGFTNWLTL